MATRRKHWRAGRKIAVFGSWRQEGLNPRAIEWAYDLGKLIAKQHLILITGGSGGTLLSCRHGCRDAGGINVAILPEMVVRETSGERSMIDVPIPTGLGVLGRMPVLTDTADYAIAIGGGAGTLIEIALTYLQRKVVLVIESLRRRGDPAISRLLTRRSYVTCHNLRLLRGYLDSKPKELVRPIHVISANVSPLKALAIANNLYQSIGMEPTTASDVDDA